MKVTFNQSVAVIIPARYASTRLPGKPLADIHGKPMIQHVYERAMQVPNVSKVLVAVDDERVADAVEQFGGKWIMTSEKHDSGTDRLHEVMLHYPADIYVNIQGDEPLIRPEDVSLLIKGMMADDSVDVGTLYHDLPSEEALDPNSVKVVLADNGDALYFSRSPIPYPRDAEQAVYRKHIGVYAYRRHAISRYASLNQPMLELSEKLEQLRLLAGGMKIRCFKVEPTGPGVDTLEGLERVRRIMAGLPEDNSLSTLANVRLVITDVDGVLTDGGIFYNETGECLKRFHVRDGLGMRLLEESGISVAVLSGRDSATLRKRVADLGVTLNRFGVKDKYQACIELMSEAGVDASQTVCIGDDTIDLPAFSACGLSYAVADAPDYVKAKATSVLSHAGGTGAFRELADAILTAQNKSEVFSTYEGFAKVMSGAAQ